MHIPCLYQETRLDLTPAFPGSSVDILLPSNGSFFSSRQSPKRRRLDQTRTTYDEDTFSKHSLAIESAIYFRPQRRATKPHNVLRSILWRVLDERTVLELQAVDLVQDRTEKNESLLTLRITFPNAIRPSCVSFAEHATEGDSSAPVVFALTQAGELFALALKKELFVKPGLAEEGLDWIKRWKPNAFNYRTTFRLYAHNDKELWASLTDGALVRLDSDNGSGWRESFFTHGSWKSSMRGLIPWKSSSSIRFEDIDLLPNATISLELSPDRKHIWAVGLDHMLRAWNVETGRLVFAQDLAGDNTREVEKPAEQCIPPTRAKLLQILPSEEDYYTLITFSPITREFKFWLIRDLESASSTSWENASPGSTFIPPMEALENATVWAMESFFFESPRTTSGSWTLWILVRSGLKCSTYRANFRLPESTSVAMQSWRDSWVTVHGGLNSTDALRQNWHNPSDVEALSSQCDSTSIVERWLDFLFYPGRFTASTLETALAVYCRSPGSHSGKHKFKASASESSLKARICEAVGSSVYLEPADTDRLTYARYQRNLAVQWQIFYGVVKDLHTRREKVLCLSYDTEERLPWLVSADSISPLRLSSQLELLWHNRVSFANPHNLLPGSLLLESLSDAATSQLGQLFFALDILRSSLSKAFLWNFASIIRPQILESESEIKLEDVQLIYDSSGFNGQISDEDFTNFNDALELLGGLKNMDDDLLIGVLVLLEESQRGRSHKKQLNRYGARALIRGAQETLQLGSDILLSLLLLVTFVVGDLEEDSLAESFDPVRVYSAVASKVREFDLLAWLTATDFCDSGVSDDKESPRTGDDLLHIEGTYQTTLFEYLFIGDWSAIHHPSAPTAELLTYWCRAWIFGLRLSEQYDKISCHVFATLIKRNDAKLALNFLAFVPNTPWAEYLGGRLSLLTSDYTAAALQFKQAAGGLSSGKFLIPAELDSANLLDGVERTYLNDGTSRYFQHITDLFEHSKVPSYAGEFAQMALQALGGEKKMDASLRTDILSRLFSASLQTFRFETAFSALVQHTDLALRRSALKSLVQVMLKENQIQTLLNLPYPTDLAVEADDQLNNLASKHTANPPSTLLEPATQETEVLPYHKILYAFRLQRDDLRGAASCLWDRLELLRQEQRRGLRGEDVDDEVAQSYLALINTLSLMDHNQAWILRKLPASGEAKEKRKVITLESVRRAWQEELDRVADVAAGRFTFGLGESEMELEA